MPPMPHASPHRASPNRRPSSARGVQAVACLAALVLAVPGPPLDAGDTVEGIGAADRIVVRGATHLDGEALRRALVHDTDVVWSSRPHAARDAFIDLVVHKAALALERAGFAEAQVRADVETSDGVERLVLDVTEGPRFDAGAIRVVGLPDDVGRRLVRFLSESQPPPEAASRPIHLPDGTAATIWVAADGRIVAGERPVWTTGVPAACDAVAMHHVQSEVARFLRQEGHLAVTTPPLMRRTRTRSARPGDRRRPADLSRARSRSGVFDVAIEPAGDDRVDLVVTVHDLPPRATLERIELLAGATPGARTTEAALATYLGIEAGRPVTEADRLVWRDRLRRSGRFLRHDVEFRVDPTDPAAVVARFQLEEYSSATPLAEPASRAEETMLRCHDWIEEAIGSGDELVLELSPAAAAAPAARLIIAPATGLCLAMQPDGDERCGLAVSGSCVSLLPAGGTGRLEVPVPSWLGLTTTLSLSLTREREPDTDAPVFRRQLSCGCGLRSVPVDAAEGGTGPALGLAIEPVAAVALVHEDSPPVRFEGETMVVEVRGATCRFDTASGRPLGVSLAGEGMAGCRLSLERRQAAFAPAVEALREAAGPDVFRGDVPLESVVGFLLSDQVAAACGRIADAAGLDGAVREAWQPRLAAIVAAVRSCRDHGGLTRGDHVLAAASADTATARAAALEIPLEVEPGTPGAAHKALVRHVAAVAWRLTEERCGRDAWPAALVRAGACAMTGDPAVLDELAQFMASDDHGPLAHASAALVVPMPPLAAALARRGQDRLSTVAFHTDCHPLLAAAAAFGLDTCCVSVLRSLDDQTAREIGAAACGDTEILLPLVRPLRAHAEHEEAVHGLQDALDAWWDAALRPLVAKQLAEIASPRTAAATGPEDRQPVK